MNYSILGEQIQRLRKEAKLTQRELGESIGVSASAVSQWESGGTPDVALLPAIADRLGVTIDTLFGREGGEGLDMPKVLEAWLKNRPENSKLQDLSELLWRGTWASFIPFDNVLHYPESCEVKDAEGKSEIGHLVIAGENGCILGVGGRDMSFMTVFPEPADGYERYLLSDEAYQSFFALLSKPGCIKLLRWLSKQKLNYYVADIVAEPADLSVEACEALLAEMEKANLLFQIDLTLPEKSVHAYKLNQDGSIIPFLYFTRWLSEEKWSLVNSYSRERPWLESKNKTEKREK